MSIIEKALDKLDQTRREEDDSRRAGSTDAELAVLSRRSGAKSPNFEKANSRGRPETAVDPDDERRTPKQMSGFGTPRRGKKTKPVIHKVKLNRKKMRQGGFILPDTADGILGEQFRYIKRPILLKTVRYEPDNPLRPNLIMVTSSVPGEGKTFTAINLAISMAMEIERSVLLVDADFMKPDVCRNLGVEAKCGLTDLLINPKIKLEDALLETDIDGLALLPSGMHHSHVTEFFSSPAMTELSDKLSRIFDIVIFDTMPLLARSGANVLAGHVGQIVFVAEALKTRRGVIQEALGVLDSPGKVGLLLNKCRERSRLKYRYGYSHARPR